MITIYFLVILFVIFFIKYHLGRLGLYKFSWGCNGPRTLPIVGSALSLRGTPEDITTYLRKLYHSYDSPLIDWFGPLPMYHVKEPEEAFVVLNSPHLLQKAKFYKAMQWAVGDSIFSTLDIGIWKSHRRALAPTFNSIMLDSYSLVFQKRAKNIVNSLEKYVGKGEFNILEETDKYALASIYETVMGQEISAGNEEDIRYLRNLEQTKYNLMDRMFTLFYHYDVIFRRSKLYKDGSAVLKEIYEYFRKSILDKRADKETGKDSGMNMKNNFLDKLLEMTGEGQVYTDQDCINEVFLFIVAGSDTCAYQLACTCLMLAMHPEVQERAYREIKDLCGDSDREITKNDIQNLPYLERVIKETMRLFPILNALAREAQDDVQIGSRTIPKGMNCVLNLIEYHRDPRRWPDPLKFNPDRFLPEEVAKRQPYEYIPYSAGPRNCIGYKYAHINLVMTMAPIVRAYRFETRHKSITGLRYGMAIITRLLSGHLVTIEKRI